MQSFRVDGSIDCAILQGSFDELEVPAPYKAKVSSLEGAAGVLISSSSDPLDILSTSLAMRGASPSPHHQIRCAARCTDVSLELAN